MSTSECQALSDRLDRVCEVIHTLNLFHEAQNAGEEQKAVSLLDEAREQAQAFLPQPVNPS